MQYGKGKDGQWSPCKAKPENYGKPPCYHTDHQNMSRNEAESLNEESFKESRPAASASLRKNNHQAANTSFKHRRDIVNNALREVANDPDVNTYTEYAINRLASILDNATITKGDDDTNDDNAIIEASFNYDQQGPGGSRSDYLSSAIGSSLTGYHVHLGNRDEVINKLRNDISVTALDTYRACDELGIPRVEPAYHDNESVSSYGGYGSYGTHHENRVSEESIRRAEEKRKATIQAKHEKARAERTAGLEPDMTELVESGITTGSARRTSNDNVDALYRCARKLQADGFTADEIKNRGAELRKEYSSIAKAKGVKLTKFTNTKVPAWNVMAVYITSKYGKDTAVKVMTDRDSLLPENTHRPDGRYEENRYITSFLTALGED